MKMGKYNMKTPAIMHEDGQNILFDACYYRYMTFICKCYFASHGTMRYVKPYYLDVTVSTGGEHFKHKYAAARKLKQFLRDSNFNICFIYFEHKGKGYVV